MRKYVLKRLCLGLIVLIGVVTVTFLMTRVLPTDPAYKWAGPKATSEQLELAREELGLNLPMYKQFGNYVSDLLHGDLGISYSTRRQIIDELTEYVPATLELVFYGAVIGIVAGLFLGIYSAKYKNKWIDHFIRFLSIGAVSVPTFALAMILQLIFYSKLGILPLGGRMTPQLTIIYDIPTVTGWYSIDSLLAGNMGAFKDVMIHLILPAVPIALGPLGQVARMTRSSLLEVLGEEYITSGRSYGIRESKILWKYTLKNTLGSVATATALSLGYTLVNTFLVEAIFGWPGIGSYVSDCVLEMNYPGIMAVTLFSTIAYLVLNLIADIIVAVDPRVRL